MQSFGDANLQRFLLQTIVYSDIFDYPLTFEEIVKFLVGESEIEAGVVRENLKILTDNERLPAGKAGVYTNGEFYFLKGRKEIVELRKRRGEWSEKKWEIARKTAQKLRVIPIIKMVGITGALAMGNCKEDDDIDLMIVTAADRLWLTRLLLYLSAPLLGIKRRKPGEKSVKDKVCFNLFLEENHLRIAPKNLFLAHEICQVKPLLNKGKTYEKFLWENQWVKKFLPNGVKISSKFKVQSSKWGKKHPISQYPNILMSLLDSLAFKLQYLYMKPRMTVEKVSRYQAFFHPVDLQCKIEAEFEQVLRKS